MINRRNITQNSINSLIRGLRKLEKWLDKDNKSENEYGYEKLSPKTDIENNYFEEIEWAVENKEITNIALGGPYGAGKSSIIKSYMDKRREHKYLNISLAYFSNEEGKDKPSTSNIEENILKQMFYRVKHSKVPYSRYKRIKNTKLIYRVTIFVVAVFSICSGIGIFNPKLMNKISENIKLLNSTYENIKLGYIYGIVFIITTFVLLIKFIHFVNANIKLTKISTKVSQSTVEFGNYEDDKSIFNKNIDEILYFFEVNKYNIVIFEDIDRFDNIEIFVKLRELNELINNCEQIKKKVTFIYAVKEDMFEDGKNRTKFFDFIIPIIPVINSSNSIEIMSKKLKENSLDKYLDKNFINDITIYIDDMRILTNVYNEFRMYKGKLCSIDLNLNMNNLFGMIVYKNIYPKDFADLQFNEGMVADVFKNKSYIEDIIKDLDNQWNQIEGDIDFINNTFINDIDELKTIYLDCLNIDKSEKLYIDGISYDYEDFKKNILRDGDKLETVVGYSTTGYASRSRRKSVKEILELNKNRQDYYQRLKLITIKKDKNIEKLKIKLTELKNKKQKIQLMSVKEMISEYGVESIINESTRNKKLIVYLLRNGYIDEMYNSYVTYFYEGSLTNEDMKFVQSIKNQDALPFNYRIHNVNRILDRLYISEFERTEILNFDLFNFIISNLDKFKIYYEAIIQNLSNEEKRSKEFIDSYINLNQNLDIFIKSMCEKWTNIWDYIYRESNYPTVKIDEYLINLIKFLDVNELLKINKGNLLSEYIGKKEGFLKLIKSIDNNEKIKDVLKSLEIRFDYIDSNEVDQEMVDYVYENNLYKINYKMIRFILERYSNNIDIEKLKTCNYTTIRESKCGNLINYIDLNIEVYIENIFLKLDENINESETYLIELLGQNEISIKNKYNIIDKEKFKVGDINKVDESLWMYLFRRDKVFIRWMNVLSYLSSNNIDKDIVIKLLNNKENYISLKNEKIDKDTLYIENINNICKNIILEQNVSTQSFVSLLPKLKELCNLYESEKYFDDFIKEHISLLQKSKVNILINLNLLSLNLDNFRYIKNNFNSKEYIKLIENDIDGYTRDYRSYDLNSKDLIILLKSQAINEVDKEFIMNNIIVENINHDRVYEGLELELASYVIDNGKKINDFLLKYFLESNIGKSYKVLILNTKINQLSEDDISLAIDKIGNNYVNRLRDGRVELIGNNKINIVKGREFESEESIECLTI